MIAVVAATAALRAAVSVRGFLASLGASMVMGVAVTGMHYMGMNGVSVHPHGTGGGAPPGGSPTSIMLPILIGPAAFLLLAGVIVMFGPLLVLGAGEWSDGAGGTGRRHAGPAPSRERAANPVTAPPLGPAPRDDRTW